MRQKKHVPFFIVAGLLLIGIIFLFASTFSSKAQGIISGPKPLSLKGVTVANFTSDNWSQNLGNYGIALYTGIDYTTQLTNWDWQNTSAPKDRECLFIPYNSATFQKRSECDGMVTAGSGADIADQTLVIATSQDAQAITFKVPKSPPSYYREDGITRWRIRGGVRFYIDDAGNTYHCRADHDYGTDAPTYSKGCDLTFTQAAVPEHLAFAGSGIKRNNGICQTSAENYYNAPEDCTTKPYNADAKFQSHGGSQTIGITAGNIIQLKNTGTVSDTFRITMTKNPESRCGLKLTSDPDPVDVSGLPKILEVTLAVNEMKPVSVNCKTAGMTDGQSLNFGAKTFSVGALTIGATDVQATVGEDEDTLTVEELKCSDPDNEDAWKMGAAIPRIEPSIKGTTAGKTYSYTDSCKDISTVWESSCGVQGPVQATVVCSKGCVEGRCRTQAEYDALNTEKCGKKFLCGTDNALYGKGSYQINMDSCLINTTGENLVKQCSGEETCNASAGTCDPKPKPDNPGSMTINEVSGLTNKYNVKVEDLDGISEFLLTRANGESLYGGNPNCQKNVTSSTLTIQSSDNPLTGYIIDCSPLKRKIEFNLKVSSPEIPPISPRVCGEGEIMCSDGCYKGTSCPVIPPTIPPVTRPAPDTDDDTAVPSEMACRQQLESYARELDGYGVMLRDLRRAGAGKALDAKIVSPQEAAIFRPLEQALEQTHVFIKNSYTGCNLTTIEEKMKAFRTEFQTKTASLQQEFALTTSCRDFKNEISRRVSELRSESKQLAETYGKETLTNFEQYIKEYESLQTKADDACKNADTIALDDLRFDRDALEEAVRNTYTSFQDKKLNNYVKERLEKVRAALSDVAVTDKNRRYHDKMKALLEEAEARYEDNEPNSALRLLDEAMKIQKSLGVDIAIDVRDLFSDRFEDEIIDRIVEKVASRLEENVTALVDAQFQSVAAKIAELGARIDEASQSLANLTMVAEEKQKQLLTVKENLLARAQEVEEKLKAVKLKNQLRIDLESAIGDVSTLNWVPSLGGEIQARTTSILAALEAGDIVESDIAEYQNFVRAKAEENKDACYQQDICPFRDFHMHEWFFGPAVFNAERGYMTGRKDARGNSTGDFNPGGMTLRIEALAMAMRLFEVPTGDDGPLTRADITGVPEWGIPYVNGALKKGIQLDYSQSWNTPISRREAAILLVAVSQGEIPLQTAIDKASAYKDYREFKNDDGALRAIESLSTFEIMQGSEGYFKPNEYLRRSEFAAINERTAKNIEIFPPSGG